MAYYLSARYGTDLTGSAKAMDMIHKVSGLTHRHPIAQSACGIYVNIAARLLAGTDKAAAVQEGVSASVGWYRRHEKFEEALPVWEPLLDIVSLAEKPEREIGSSGYVVDTLIASLWCLLTTDCYHMCVLKAVNLGEDTDTTGAVAGGLAGLVYGYDGIPRDWLDALKGKPIIEKACEAMEREES